jgi:hypothetical protein
MLRQSLAVGSLAAVMLAAPVPASGGDDGGSGGVDREARVATLQATLDDDEPAATRWWALWSAGFGASVVGNGIATFAFGPGAERDSARVQTVTSAIALVSTLVIPMPAKSAGSRLRAFEGPPEARAQEAERLFAASAEAEELGASWLTHAGAIVVNGAAASWLAWHDGHPWHGLLAFATGELVAELKIATMPRGALHARRARGAQAGAGIAWTAAIAPIPGGTWLGVGGSF